MYLLQFRFCSEVQKQRVSDFLYSLTVFRTLHPLHHELSFSYD